MGAVSRRHGPRVASLLAVAAVVGVGGAAVLSGSDTGASGDRPRPDAADATSGGLPRSTARTAPTFSGAAALPTIPAGRLQGRLVHSNVNCRTATLDLATLRVDEPRAGCLAGVSASGRFALLRETLDGPAHVVDLRSGRAARTPVRLATGRPPTLDDDGAVHRCSNGFNETLRFGRATPSRRAGCLPVRLGGRPYLAPSPENPPLQLEDSTGRAFPFDPSAPPGSPPYVLAGSPDGRVLAVASADDRGDAIVALYRVRDGTWVDGWALGPDTEPRAVRLAGDGAAVAVLVRERGRPTDDWRLLRPGRPSPVAGVGGERLLDASFAPDGRHVAVTTQPGRTAVILDTEAFVPLGRLPLDQVVGLAWLA